jgi:pimeloyl-ACP methyl ester carboxylesterase
MRRVLRAWCVATILAFPIVGPGALVAAGDDGPARPIPPDRPTRTILRPTEIPALAPLSVQTPSDRTVILLVSGLGSDTSDGMFDPMIEALSRDPRYEIRRFGRDPTHPYDTLGSIDENADQLIAEVRDLARTHPKIDIVAHSMGGAVVDDAFRRGLSATDKVDTYIALASPHNGSTEARVGQVFLAISALFDAAPDLRAITAFVAHDIGSRAARDLAFVHSGPPPYGVTRLDVRMATDAIVTAPDAWTPGVTSRTLLPTSAGSIEGHSGVTTDPQAIDLVTTTIASGRPPAVDWRGAILGLAAWSASTLVEQHALKMYCVLGVVLLGCAIGLSIVRRRRGLPLGFP